MTADHEILALRRGFVAEALDLAYVHASWTSRYLQDGLDTQALKSFEMFLAAARSAADEMKVIRSAAESQKLAAEAATEYRRDRERGRPARQKPMVAA